MAAGSIASSADLASSNRHSTRRTCVWRRSRRCSCGSRHCPTFSHAPNSKPRTLIKVERGDDFLGRAAWDPAEHPRVGVPPNPGWFAPADGAGGNSSQQFAQEEEERAPEETLDPLAPMRQAQWDGAIATFREIDPTNPNLTYLANPGSAPSEEALDRLNAAVEAAEIKRVTGKLMPDGKPIGKLGRGPDVRVVHGGLEELGRCSITCALEGLFGNRSLSGLSFRLPLDTGFIMYRPNSRSGGPAIDINMLSVSFDKIHFQQGD